MIDTERSIALLHGQSEFNSLLAPQDDGINLFADAMFRKDQA